MTDFSHNPLGNGSESSLWSSSSRVVVSLWPGQQPSNPLPFLSAQSAGPPHLCSHACASPSASQLVQHIHPHSRLLVLWCSRWCATLLFTWRMNAGKEETTKNNVFVSKFSYWVLAGWAMGQREVRPKLQRQYIMPLESNQLSEIGS